MPKKMKRLTRADKVALTKVTDEFQTADAIGVPSETLENLAAHGHVRAVLDFGSMNYRITVGGRAFIATLPLKGAA